jgi:hypothetical protein
MSTRPIGQNLDVHHGHFLYTFFLPDEMANAMRIITSKDSFLGTCLYSGKVEKKSVTLNGNNIITFVARKNQLYVYFFPSFLPPQENFPPVALHQAGCDFFCTYAKKGEKF